MVNGNMGSTCKELHVEFVEAHKASLVDLFKFDRRRRLGGNVIENSVDSLDLA